TTLRRAMPERATRGSVPLRSPSDSAEEGSRDIPDSSHWTCSPILDGERPTLVIPPASRDAKIPRRVALEPEAEPLQERDRRYIVGLGVGLQSVEPMDPEGA